MSCLNDVSVLIIGYDGYKDVWDHDVDLMNTFWKNRQKIAFDCFYSNNQFNKINCCNGSKRKIL